MEWMNIYKHIDTYIHKHIDVLLFQEQQSENIEYGAYWYVKI